METAGIPSLPAHVLMAPVAGTAGVAALGDDPGDRARRRARFGICLWNQAAAIEDVLGTARLADDLGYEHLWMWDHLLSIYGEPDQPVFDSWTVLAAVAATTANIHLGPLVTANTFRSPVLLAKIATTVDHLSGGRVILGMGGGWFEREHHAAGIDFGRGFGERLDRLDEAVGLISSLLRGERVTSDGPAYPVADLRLEPRPVRGRIPILIGGRGKTKTLRTAARYAGIWNAYGTPEELLEHDEVLRAHCEAEGRDHSEIERSVQAKVVVRDTVEQAVDAFARMLEANRTVWAGKGVGAEPDMVRRSVFPDPDSAIWLGSPDSLTELICRYVDVGFTTFMAEIPAPYDRETVERLIGEVAPMVEKHAAGGGGKEYT